MMAEKMASKWISFVSVLCFIIGCPQDGSADSLACTNLQKTFPNCECRVPEGVDVVVDCSNKGLTETPTIEVQYSGKIYKLDLSNNSITALTKNSFDGLKIKNIDLSGNSLQSVDNDTFISMKNTMNTLVIEGNGSNLPPISALKQVSTMENLSMRNYNVPYLERSEMLFLPFVNLKSLTLDSWKLKHIEGSSFSGLKSLTTLSIINQPDLEIIPLEALREDPFCLVLLTLQISHTKIKSIDNKAFEKLDSLKNLDLSFNQIEQLDPNCFSGVEDTLENINLRHNVLNNQNVNQGFSAIAGLSGLEALKQLDLAENMFTAIPELSNLGTNQPISLILDKNKIKQVQENAFRGYAHQIKNLYLNGNLIRGMDQNSFQGVTQLESLYVNSQQGVDSSNFILPISITNSSSKLQILSATTQTVDPTYLWNVVKQSTSLQALYLSSTDLSDIPDLIFEKVTSLQILDLSHNQIQKLTQKSLVGLRQLKRLYLEGNSLETIPSCLFYQFNYPITVTLGYMGIKCDCKIKTLVEYLQNGNLVQDPNKEPAKCADQNPLTIKDPNNLVCNPTYNEPSCEEFYTTQPPSTTQIPFTNPAPKLNVNVVEVTMNTVIASWSLTNKQDLKSFTFYVLVTSSGVKEFKRENLNPSQTEEVARGLNADTHISVCVTAVFHTQQKVTKCVLNKTQSNDLIKQGQNDNSNSANTAIIVGCVVAGVALIGIVIAITVLLVFRKRPKKAPDAYAAPTQPRNFAKAELPSMTDESRTFKKPKANGKKAHPEGMQVVAISDGQTSPGPRVGRVNMMFQPEDGYEPMSNFKKEKQRGSSSTYENDHDALPPTPGQDSRPPSYPGYYNQGFQEDKYDEIEVAI